MHATREQQLAMRFDRHSIISASAGSGKTTVLVQRYVKLILNGVDVRHIAAITFTRKAAAEMLVRVTEAIEDLSRLETNPQKLQKLKEIRERLTSARISTIHSFCGRLLREFPIEANVHPNFIEQSEHDGLLMRRSASEQSIVEFLTNADTKIITENLFLALGRDTLQSYIETILANREMLSELRKFYSNSDEDCLNNAESYGINFILPIVKSTIEAISIIVSEISPFKLKIKQSEKLDETRQSTQRLLELKRYANHRQSLSEIIKLLSSDKLPVFKKNGELRSEFKKICEIETTSFLSTIANGFVLAESLVKTIDNLALDEEMIRLGRVIFAISERAASDIEERKNKIGELDFDDLQLKCLDLLSNETVCRKIRRKLKYIMIDEFQDTNKLQYLLVKRLVSALTAEAHISDSPNLYVVGDAKQSIYGFRGADVRVFDRAMREIIAANLHAEKAGFLSSRVEFSDGETALLQDQERLGDIRLTASFRLSPPIAAFVNKVCSSIMPSESSGYEVGYDAMVCARKSERIEIDKNESTIAFLVAHKNRMNDSDGETGYENNTTENDEEANTMQDNKSEALMIARYIGKAISDSSSLYITEGKNEQPRKLDFRDFAILIRSRSIIDCLATALRAENIPFIIHSGAGFYSTSEITDLRSYLTFLHNPDDDIALAAILRSPFFGVSDAGLYATAYDNPAESLWKRLLNYQDLRNFTPNYALLRARAILTELLPLAPRLTIPVLIRIILQRSGWHKIIAESERATQMLANIEKLLVIARDFEQKGFHNLYDFVEELALLAAGEAKESEAVISSTTNVVNIMTIHAAKGLEFPVVILCNANAKTFNNSRSQLELHNQLGICFNAPDEIEGFTIQSASFLKQCASIISRSAAEAEEKRLLYVALTRAKDHLVVSCTVKTKNDNELSAFGGFLKLILEGSGLTASELCFNHHDTNIELQEMPFLTRNGIEKRNCSIPLQIFVTPAEKVKCAAIIPEQAALPAILTEEISTESGDIIFSASQIMLYEQNTDEYIFRYRLGISANKASDIINISRIVGDEEDTIIDSFAGTVIHEVLAKIQTWIDDQQRIEHIAREILEKNERSNNSLLYRVVNECGNVASTKLLHQYKPHFSAAKIEHTLQMPIGNDFLIGTIDLLIQNDNGEWEIWDWKTNRINDFQDADILSNKYKRQLQIYALFCSILFPEQEQFTARLLFTRQANVNVKDEEWTRAFCWNRSDIKAFAKKINEIIYDIKKHDW